MSGEKRLMEGILSYNARGRRLGGLLRSTLALVLAVAALAVAPAGCTRKPAAVTVPLRFRPTARLDLNAFGNAAPRTPVYLADVRDARMTRARIGVIRIGDTKSSVFSGGREPTEFVGLVVKDLLRRSGLTVVDDRTDAALVVLAELNEFWARETTTYGARVRVTVTVQDRVGTTIWKGQISGAARRPGPSLAADDYQQVFSDASLELVERLVREQGFRNVLYNGPPVAGAFSDIR